MPKLTDIPTNIITGFLGVGKTTAINALLANKPTNEKWAVLVNEFGQIGIDQAALENQIEGVAVKELAGGCICCALGPALTTTLAMLLRRVKPDRLIIEPTGIGHPAGIIDTLQSEYFREVLDLRSVICLLDPRSIEQPEAIAQPTFQDQINLADVIVINKTDLADQKQIAKAEERCNALFPPKQAIIKSDQGRFELSLLDLVRNGELKSTYPNAHNSEVRQVTSQLTSDEAPIRLSPQPGSPLSKAAAANNLYSCGWVFSPVERFQLKELTDLLGSIPSVQRIKGVFNTDQGWIFYNQVIDEATSSSIAYRRDSRVEIIASESIEWPLIEQKLLNCRLIGNTEI